MMMLTAMAVDSGRLVKGEEEWQGRTIGWLDRSKMRATEGGGEVCRWLLKCEEKELGLD